MTRPKSKRRIKRLPLRLMMIMAAMSMLWVSPAEAAQGTGWAEVTVNIKENSGWKTTSLYFNPANNSRYRCKDSKTSFFIRFSYNVYNGNLTVANMKLTNGASRRDAIAADSFTSNLGGHSRTLTKSPMTNPGSSNYVRRQLSSSSKVRFAGSHRNNGSTYIKFNVTAKDGGRPCGPSVIIRLK